MLVFLVSPDDVGDGLAHATWDELRTRATYDQLAAWQRRRLANAIAGTLNERDTPSRLAALEAIEDLHPPRSAVLSGVLAGLIQDGPTAGPLPVKGVEGETSWVSSHPPRPERYLHDDLVVRLLGRVGTLSDVPMLTGVLQSREWFHQRSEALWALAVLNDPSAVEAMCNISLDRQPWTEVVLAVALFGDRAGERGEQLMVEARARMFPRSYPYLDACSNAINGRSFHVSIALSGVLRQDVHVLSHNFASDALRKLGAQAEPAVPTLIELLSSELAWRRRSAAAVLGSIGPGARQALPDLERLADDEDRYVSRTALWAIDRIRRPD
ncbi:MAG: HEAT repeat domain-containing protein [Planctomycetes bacterium]|nr:HEAT repeat domain-containing protein [Planctomycetota bacterium]